jgi:hypothetical protein
MCPRKSPTDVLDRAYDPDTTLSAGAKRFIDRHVTPGEKRPPAPSVRREPDQSARKRREDGSTSPVGIVILARWASGHAARHQGRRRQASGRPRRARRGRARRRSLESPLGDRPRHAGRYAAAFRPASVIVAVVVSSVATSSRSRRRERWSFICASLCSPARRRCSKLVS